MRRPDASLSPLPTPSLPPEQKKILDLLTLQPRQVEGMIQESGLTVPQVTGVLTLLEDARFGKACSGKCLRAGTVTKKAGLCTRDRLEEKHYSKEGRLRRRTITAPLPSRSIRPRETEVELSGTTGIFGVGELLCPLLSATAAVAAAATPAIAGPRLKPWLTVLPKVLVNVSDIRERLGSPEERYCCRPASAQWKYQSTVSYQAASLVPAWMEPQK